MKKLLYIAHLLLAMVLTSCYTNEIIDINDRLHDLESDNRIATIQEQVEAINSSISALESADTQLNDYIAALQAEDKSLTERLTETNSKIDSAKKELEGTISTEKAAVVAELEALKEQLESELATLKAAIETLQAKDAELEKQIAELKDYVDAELKATKDWATATFATLEQYNTVASTIATIEGTIEELNTSIATVKEEITAAYTAALEEAISALETSMKEWVNEQLTGYYTIAQMDAKLEALQNSLTEGDGALQKEIDALRESLAAQKTELTEAYTAAITEAINTNNGVFEGKIAEAIGKVNEQIAGLEERINTLEERLSAVEDSIEQIKALDITFDTTESIACMAGASVTIGYTIMGGDSKTAIEAWGDGGWSATVLPESTTTGKIKVTAPEKSTNGKVVVLATSGAGGVAMRSLHFEEGILTGILDTYEVDWEACVLKVTLRTNLDYVVEIPTEAQSWLSVAETRAAVRNETLTFTIAENPEDMPTRSVVVQLVSLYGEVLQSFKIVQDLQPLSTPIEFADQYVKKVCVEKFDTNGDGELSYKEASMVTYIPSDFLGDYGIAVKSFEELQYFINLTSIRNSAFRGCKSLTSITIPDGVTSIGNSAFSDCSSLTSITIPDSVTEIGGSAFSGCSSLTSVTIGNGVTKINSSTFYRCNSLTAVYISDIAAWCKINIQHDHIMQSNPFSNAHNLYLNGKLVTDLVIPDSVTEIGQSAFAGCSSLTSVTIPDGVTSIGNSAFSDCSSLTSITIPDSVTSIGNYAFSGCTKLASVTLPDSIVSIGESIFSGCSSLTSITIPDSVISIGDHAFHGCTSLTSVTIPDGVTEIGKYAFQGCTSLTSITIPDSVTSIGEVAFLNCSSLESFYGKFASDDGKCLIVDNVLKAFAIGCNLAEYTIPDSVTEIGYDAFYNCTSLTSITIPDSVTSIGDYAFYYCLSLTSVNIGNGVTSIGKSAFSSCESLTNVYCKPTTPPSGGANMFKNVSGYKIYVPAESVDAYKKAEYWSEYAADIVGYDF